jgi:hypothetical protein
MPPSLYHTVAPRDHGRGTRRDEAIKQQLLTPREEQQAIVDFILRADCNGFPARVKGLHQVPAKDWPQAFCKRHAEPEIARSRALDWKRHEKNICKKIVKWFELMRAQLEEADVLQENVYNTGVLLSVPCVTEAPTRGER